MRQHAVQPLQLLAELLVIRRLHLEVGLGIQQRHCAKSALQALDRLAHCCKRLLPAMQSNHALSRQIGKLESIKDAMAP